MATQHTNRLSTNGNGQLPAKQSVNTFIQELRPEIAKALPPAVAKVLTPDRICRLALTALRMNTKLAECDFKSLAGALMTAAQLGLEPNTPLGHCYLIPRRNGKTNQMEASFQIGYQGMVELAVRSGRIQTQYAFPVYQNDEFDYWYGLDSNLIHRPYLGGNRGPLVAVYAVAKYKDGGSNFVVLTIDEVEQYRKRSLASNNGPWVTDYEAMACKTAFRRLFRWLPKSTELALAVSADDSVPKWDAMTGEVLHVDQVEIEAAPTRPQIQETYEEAEVDIEEVQPEEPKQEPKRKANRAQPVQQQRVVETQAHQTQAEPDQPGQAPWQEEKTASLPSLVQPSAQGQVAKDVEVWLKGALQTIATNGPADLSDRGSLINALYTNFASEGMVSGQATLAHRQVFEIASMAPSFEVLKSSLDLCLKRLTGSTHDER